MLILVSFRQQQEDQAQHLLAAVQKRTQNPLLPIGGFDELARRIVNVRLTDVPSGGSRYLEGEE